MSTDFSIDEEHPLALELKSLHATVHRYQHEASSAAVKLQRHSLDTSYVLERNQALERENALLMEELNILRAHPNVTPQPMALQELSNALRHVSDKLTVTEETLMTRTTDLMNAFGESAIAKAEVNELSSRMRTLEEEGRLRERQLGKLLRAAQEENRMADLVVQEYADLVRNLTSKSSGSSDFASILNGGSNGSNLALIESLSEGKSGLHKLLEEFNTETDKLGTEIARLTSELVIVQSKLQAEQDTAAVDRAHLAELQIELDKLRADDETAGKMVSRYMKFSQKSNNSLSTALESLKVRHQATTTTLTAQIDYLQRCLFNEKRGSEKLRLALDELSEDISRETYGRRRETSLRLAFLGREENLAETIRRWCRKATESYQRVASAEEISHVLNGFKLAVEDSNSLLDSLNGRPALEDPSPGSLARVLAAQDTVNTLIRELQIETDKRMRLERQLAHIQGTPPPLPVRDSVPTIPTLSQVYTPFSPARSEEPAYPVNGSESLEAPVEEVAAQEPQPPTVMTVEPSQQPVTLIIPSESLTPHRPPHSAGVATPIPVTPVGGSLQPPLDSASMLCHNQLSMNDASTTRYIPLSSNTNDTMQPPQQRLLEGLARVKTRYDDLQRTFHDCHLALKDLTKSLASTPQSDTVDFVRIAVERLDDFNEDARVELEIRAADEERTIKTFETLLQVRGAIESEARFAEIKHDIQAFVDGTDKSVARIMQQFSRKLEDLTHDIASIKSFVHDLPAQDQNSFPSGSATPWSFAAGILGTTSRPVSPAPTFGSVMTSSRLRHTPSLTQIRKPSFGEMLDPLSGLNLRISQTYSSPATFKNPPVRTRTASMMNILGFGSRTNILNSPNATPGKASFAHSLADDNASEEEDIQHDVE